MHHRHLRDAAKLNVRAASALAETIQDTVLAGNVADRVMEITGKRGVDVVIENVGKAGAGLLVMRSAWRAAGGSSPAATTGDDPSAHLRRLFIRQLQVLGSTLGNRSEFQAVIDFIAEKRLKPHIDQVFALDAIHAALDRLEFWPRVRQDRPDDRRGLGSDRLASLMIAPPAPGWRGRVRETIASDLPIFGRSLTTIYG